MVPLVDGGITSMVSPRAARRDGGEPQAAYVG